MKDSPTPTLECGPSPVEDTMDLSWKGSVPKVREDEEEEKRDEEEEDSRLTEGGEEEEEEDERNNSESGGPEAEILVKKERDVGEGRKMDDHELDGQAMDSEDMAEKEDESVDYGVEDMFIDSQDSPINYAKYDNSTPAGGALTGWNACQRAGQGSKLTCDICGLACVSLNVLLVHKRSHTGERPFHCQQCGASFTQKGNLLRHIKLHSGEKPFKCPMCSYACRRRDALSGHLRTHSVEKPYKCNHCGRSYKQRSSLEEHRERCHIYMQTKSNSERGCEVIRPQGGMERAVLLDRLASNVAKRKSTMPQKFVGEAPVCLDLGFKQEPGVYQSGSDPPQSLSTPEGLPGTPLDLHQHPQKSLTLQPTASVATSPLALANGSKLDRGMPSVHSHPTAPPGHLALDPHHRNPDSDGSSRPRHASDTHRASLLQHHQQQQLPLGLGHLFVPPANGGLPFPLHPHLSLHTPLVHAPLPPHDTLRVVQGSKGEPTGAYMCVHCRVLFLDYVMFTIHMGCHGFRDPLECNVCGHVSRDRYEFSSHIARGEHYLEIK